MFATVLLAYAAVGFLIVFWFTPIGVPTLKRLGGGEVSPDLRFGFGVDDVYQLLDVYGPTGIAHWRRLLLLDLIFPGVYAALFALLAADWAGWVSAGPVWRTVAIGVPILAGVSDYVENLLLLGLLRAFPRRTPVRAVAASVFTRAKFVFSYATFAVPLLHWGAVSLGWSN